MSVDKCNNAARHVSYSVVGLHLLIQQFGRIQSVSALCSQLDSYCKEQGTVVSNNL
jgi:hypothetical protein